MNERMGTGRSNEATGAMNAFEGRPRRSRVNSNARATRAYKRKGKSLRVQVVAGVGVLVAGISIVGAAPGQSSGHEGLEPVSAAYQVVTVQGGDSLWSVAQRVNSVEDPRIVVERLRELNNLGSSVLQPGQVLRVE